MPYMTSTQLGAGRCRKASSMAKHPRSGQHVAALQEIAEDDVNETSGKYRWLSVSLQYPRCVSTKLSM